MSVFAVVPVKDLTQSKSRLSPFLSPDERAALTLAMLDHVLLTLEESGVVERVGVVSPSSRVLFLAKDAGAAALPQETRGLNNALEEGRDRAVSEGASCLLVLPADLPYLSAFDVRMLVSLLREDERAAVISPDRDEEGTNALVIRPPDALPFAFGPGSYEAHQRAARERRLELGIYDSASVSFDVDTLEDLELLRESEWPRP